MAGLRTAFDAGISVVGLDGTPFVIACCSDPGLHAAREATDRPVLGIAQSGLLTALSLGESIGVISIGSGSLARHWRAYRSLGIAQRVVVDLPLGATVAELADGARPGVPVVDPTQAACAQALGAAALGYRTR